MNKDEIVSLIVKILLMVLSPIAVKYHLDGNTMSAIAADIADAAVLGFSIWSHWNQKKVPETSIAIAPTSPSAQAAMPVGTSTALGKVVGMLLACIVLGLLATPSFAETALQKAAQRNDANKVAVSPLVAASPAGKVTQAAAVNNPLAALQTFTVDDLQAALTDAQAQVPPDQAAINCYTALIPIVQTGVANPLPQGLGGFQLLQKLRDAKAAAANIQSPSGPLAQLNIACAPLVLDVQNTLIQLGIVSGGVVASGGLTLPVSLGALLPFK